jgi:hypothetical protein
MGRFKMWQMLLAGLGIIILLGIIIIGAGSLNFRNSFNANANEVLAANISNKGIITEKDLAGLPDTVKRYLRYTGVIDKEKINTVRLKQKGTLRQTTEDSWKSITAVEYFSVSSPSFVWMGQMTVGPFSIIAARDSYLEKHGRMFIKMLGVKTIGDVEGEEMDYSSLVRYLNEMMWFPTAFVNDNIRWDAIDNNSARVTITDDTKSASAILFFNEKGAITNFVGERYHEVNGLYVKDIWETPMTDYGEFNGLQLPIRGYALWKMSSGDFSYINLEITELEYNIAETFR